MVSTNGRITNIRGAESSLNFEGAAVAVAWCIPDSGRVTLVRNNSGRVDTAGLRSSNFKSEVTAVKFCFQIQLVPSQHGTFRRVRSRTWWGMELQWRRELPSRTVIFITPGRTQVETTLCAHPPPAPIIQTRGQRASSEALMSTSN